MFNGRINPLLGITKLNKRCTGNKVYINICGGSFLERILLIEGGEV